MPLKVPNNAEVAYLAHLPGAEIGQETTKSTSQVGFSPRCGVDSGHRDGFVRSLPPPPSGRRGGQVLCLSFHRLLRKLIVSRCLFIGKRWGRA